MLFLDTLQIHSTEDDFNSLNDEHLEEQRKRPLLKKHEEQQSALDELDKFGPQEEQQVNQFFCSALRPFLRSFHEL